MGFRAQIAYCSWYLGPKTIVFGSLDRRALFDEDFRQPPDQFVVRMPLDLVDLSILSRQYEAT